MYGMSVKSEEVGRVVQTNICSRLRINELNE